jgi:hypothetical protein
LQQRALVGNLGSRACVSRNPDALGGNKENIGKPSRQTTE